MRLISIALLSTPASMPMWLPSSEGIFSISRHILEACRAHRQVFEALGCQRAGWDVAVGSSRALLSLACLLRASHLGKSGRTRGRWCSLHKKRLGLVACVPDHTSMRLSNPRHKPCRAIPCMRQGRRCDTWTCSRRCTRTLATQMPRLAWRLLERVS
jgi:hypothetical protein